MFKQLLDYAGQKEDYVSGRFSGKFGSKKHLPILPTLIFPFSRFSPFPPLPSFSKTEEKFLLQTE
jgi:hypothetical protein